MASNTGMPSIIRSIEKGWPKDREKLSNWTAKLQEAGIPWATTPDYDIFELIVENCEVLITASNANSDTKTVNIDHQSKQIDLT